MPAKMTPLVIPLGGKDRTFGLFSVQDLCALTDLLPASITDRDLIEVSKLYQWASNVNGSTHMLLMAGKKYDPTLTFSEVQGWSSIMRRVRAACAIFEASIFHGEEDASDPKPAGDVTGRSMPVTSPTISPDSETLGK